MSVEETGWYDNVCVYCNGSGVVPTYEDGDVPCSSCDGRGQWDEKKTQ